jgi:hypothetical protein
MDMAPNHPYWMLEIQLSFNQPMTHGVSTWDSGAIIEIRIIKIIK